MSKAIESPVWPWFEQVVEALVRLLDRAEAGELAHRPQPAPVHRGIRPAREGIGAGMADPLLQIRTDVLGPVQRLDLLAGDGRELGLALGRRLVASPPLLAAGAERDPAVRGSQNSRNSTYRPAGTRRSPDERGGSGVLGGEVAARIRAAASASRESSARSASRRAARCRSSASFEGFGRASATRRPLGRISARTARRSLSCGARRTRPRRSSPSIVLVMLVGWTCRRSPILPRGSEPRREK